MEIVGGIQATIIFSILYFLIFFPVGVVIRISKDYLRIKPKPKWMGMEANSKSLEKLREQ